MELDFRLLFQEDFTKGLLAEGEREDGRKTSQWRAVTVNAGSIGSSDGSAVVKMGGACAVCAVKAELANPPQDHPDQGYLLINVELPAANSSRSTHMLLAQGQSISQTLQEILTSCDCVGLKQLCIEEGKLCWVLHVDVVFVSVSGVGLDTATLAALVALRDTTLPVVYVESGSPRVSSEKKPLQVSALPVVTSFGLSTEWLPLLDPSAAELLLCSGLLSVVVLESGEMAGIYKFGGPGLEPLSLQQCVEAARRRGQKVTVLLNTVHDSSCMQMS